MAKLLFGGSIITVPEALANSLIKIQTLNHNISSKIPEITHPEYDSEAANWDKWRFVYEGGDDFVENFLVKFSKRETSADFERRKQISPIPAFAKGSITEIKNSIFQRTSDIIRKDGPESYRNSCLGQLGGVDRGGATMNWFIGHHILPELLTMKKVGVYVDNEILGSSLAERGNKHPYIYHYKAENIRSWSYANKATRDFQAVLLREYVENIDPETKLPIDIKEQYRHVYLNDSGFVTVQFYNEFGDKINDLITLTIKRIPFVTFEITESLLKDVANHQIALLNLESSDVSSGLKGNFPLYTEQYDALANNQLIRRAQQDFNVQYGNPTAEILNGACETEKTGNDDITVGATEGRRYGKDLERPKFINPSSEPLVVSMQKQKNLKEDIRVLVQLALSNIQSKMASAESKSIDQQGLESGLSYIGLELEHGERKIGGLWAMYENLKPPTVNYPKQYSLKSDKEITDLVDHLKKIRDEVPSRTYQKEINIEIARITVGNKVPLEVMSLIESEIKASEYITSNPEIIQQDVDSGLVSNALASKARGYPEGQSVIAQEDSAKKAALIVQAQAKDNPAARGVKELGGDAELEKLES